MALVTHLNIRDGEILGTKLNSAEKYTVSGLTASLLAIGTGLTDPPRGCIDIKSNAGLSAYFDSTSANSNTEVIIKGPTTEWHINNNDGSNGSLYFKETQSGTTLLCGTSGGGGGGAASDAGGAGGAGFVSISWVGNW